MLFSSCTEKENGITYVVSPWSDQSGTITFDTTWHGTDTLYYDGEHLYHKGRNNR